MTEVDELMLRAAMRRVNTAARFRCERLATPQDWEFVLDEHPDKAALDAVVQEWYPQVMKWAS